MTTRPLSRALHLASAGYAVWCFVNPRHLGDALAEDPSHAPDFDDVALTYGARDLVISVVGLVGPAAAVRTATVVRALSDASDSAVLSRDARVGSNRGKALAVTLGWAALNAVALAVDDLRAD